MTHSAPLDRARENATGLVSVLVTGTWLAALFTGQGWWLPFMLFGYIVLVPVTALLFGDEEDVAEWWDDEDNVDVGTADEHTDDQLDALETLRERYARGELDETVTVGEIPPLKILLGNLKRSVVILHVEFPIATHSGVNLTRDENAFILNPTEWALSNSYHGHASRIAFTGIGVWRKFFVIISLPYLICFILVGWIWFLCDSKRHLKFRKLKQSVWSKELHRGIFHGLARCECQRFRRRPSKGRREFFGVCLRCGRTVVIDTLSYLCRCRHYADLYFFNTGTTVGNPR